MLNSNHRAHRAHRELRMFFSKPRVLLLSFQEKKILCVLCVLCGDLPRKRSSSVGNA